MRSRLPRGGACTGAWVRGPELSTHGMGTTLADAQIKRLGSPAAVGVHDNVTAL